MANAETAEFTAAGMMILTPDAGGAPREVAVTAEGGILHLSFEGTQWDVAYTISGNVLTMVDAASAQAITYDRVAN